MDFDGFEWDEGNRDKCRKHGVSIEEIESLFEATLLVGPDPFEGERRFRAFGKTMAGRGVLVVFTLRRSASHRLIRPISARFMHKKEIRKYEQEISHTEQ